ncbi:thiamine phosphate synthase [Halobacillus karajensis]|uniref:Thiamine-phosphate synthase n=1 Tax=Halobacillus karajensis TaxID=195088 RepID=A0A059NVG2_9BACI|nr:thiamine phosphate synthase [Halobacillus karajensis]CDQ18619.1 Thiamine-phosphate synthase [Halobacillus karajensis]CDQ23309.1 Thiamine-phosphate synthase [Halobacillus karajensis]CDQ26791.1 Thiamine-phosphate synthase [Halobacillus karajensis]
MLASKLRKYFIMGSQNCERDPLVILEEAIHGGITCFQYREKGEGSLTGQAKYSLGHKLRKRCAEAGILFIVNDDVELFDALDADGLHVGQEDLSVEDVRLKYPDTIIGLSVSNEDELNRSPLHLVDYLGAGPVYPTSSKKNAKPVVGTEWVKEVKRQVSPLPVVGIGGIHSGNANEVLDAGADGVAVISAIAQAEDVKATVQSI